MRSEIAEAKDDLEKIEFVIGLFEQNKSDKAIDRALGSKDVQRKIRRAAEDLTYFWYQVEHAPRD
jgi:hypothetical protein